MTFVDPTCRGCHHCEERETSPSPSSGRLLDGYRERHSKPPALGCSLVAHRDIGFCGGCHPHGQAGEVSGWRLLAMAERGIPRQPWEAEQ